MPNLILRILLRIARKLAFKRFEAFIVELAAKYTKGRFVDTFPEVPDIEEFPGIVIFNKEGEEDNDIKKAVVAAGAGLGTGILLATQVGDKVSGSDIKSGIDDLNGATEDWDEGGLLTTLAIMGKDSLSSIADSINEKDFEFNLPDFEFTPLPPYQRIFLDEKTKESSYGHKKVQRVNTYQHQQVLLLKLEEDRYLDMEEKLSLRKDTR